MTQETLPETAAHAGGSPCGAVRCEMDLALQRAIACNCSMCQKKGSLLTFAPADNNFTQKSGADSLSDYQFNKRMIHHFFCKTYGVASLARGRDPKGNEMVAVNVRCLDDVDLDTLTIQYIDGRSF